MATRRLSNRRRVDRLDDNLLGQLHNKTSWEMFIDDDAEFTRDELLEAWSIHKEAVMRSWFELPENARSAPAARPWAWWEFEHQGRPEYCGDGPPAGNPCHWSPFDPDYELVCDYLERIGELQPFELEAVARNHDLYDTAREGRAEERARAAREGFEVVK